MKSEKLLTISRKLGCYTVDFRIWEKKAKTPKISKRKLKNPWIISRENIFKRQGVKYLWHQFNIYDPDLYIAHYQDSKWPWQLNEGHIFERPELYWSSCWNGIRTSKLSFHSVYRTFPHLLVFPYTNILSDITNPKKMFCPNAWMKSPLTAPFLNPGDSDVVRNLISYSCHFWNHFNECPELFFKHLISFCLSLLSLFRVGVYFLYASIL